MTVEQQGQQVLDEEPTELTLQSIYQQLVAANELILTIPAEEEIPLRTGLAKVKNKHNSRLKQSGIAPDKVTLQYTFNPHKNDKGELVEGLVDAHIALVQKSGITVYSMKTPDPNL